ncbi:MAG TPA: DNA internalization-related competence protein ComEC/Rec2 [Nocardioidaceae bacterium]|nr:DNA internalization-related competence protein ComEC/Rec2 [Nocardioidaceae bacterium]
MTVPDLRAVLLAVAAWAGALAGFLLPAAVLVGAVLVGAALVGAVLVGAVLVGALWAASPRGGRRFWARRTTVGVLVVATAAAWVAVLHVHAVRASPVAVLARHQAFATVTGTVTSDPVVKQGRYGPFGMLRVRAEHVSAHGAVQGTSVPVLVFGDSSLHVVRLGSTVRIEGRLKPSDSTDLAAVLSTSRAPRVLAEPGPLLDAAAAVRAGIRAAAAPLGPDEGALLPALVDGEDTAMSDQLVQDFQVSGLTHLAAVSGTNLTLLVGFLLIVARWAGVRARGLVVVGALGVLGFVLLARGQPSVLRAAAMGSVALIGMGSNGRQRGGRALGVAVVALLLFDPWLATSLGFVLSTLATAGILFLAPAWRDSLMTWLPRWAAEAIAVPFAAQLVCTPVIAAISGRVSLVAVLANMLVAAAVGPATVLGLVGGLVVLVVPPLGLLCGRVAGWFAWWIVTVAEHSARLPTAALDWSAGWVPVAVLAGVCLVAALALPRLLAHRWWCAGGAVLLAVVVTRPLPTPGWPPDGWVLIACDVGQGDGLVLNAGHGAAVVVDTGPDPPLMSRCLTRLGVQRIPAVVLTHFHADHIDGLPAVLAGWPVGVVDVTATRVPPEGAAEVGRWTRAAQVPVRVPSYGEVDRVGELTWQVLGPAREVFGDDNAEEGSIANNASLVLLVQVRGMSILMSGDMEPEAQQILHRDYPGLHVDVLKVPHHGSRYQDPALLGSLGARLAVISVGAVNDYGHPAPSTVRLLHHDGMLVRRTDRDGAVAVVVRDHRLAVVTRH